jgi:predicted nucleotidyltransferase
MIDLRPEHLAEVKRILAFDVPECRVLVFGSRVTGKAQPLSDLDLALIGPARLSDRRLEHLRNMFSISELPILVDVVDWHRLAPEFRARVESQCEELPLD